jgi:DMSO/TMAO reductase YedYZ molybdopterin-dependent catalytic subunit
MHKDPEMRETLPIHLCDRSDVQRHVLRVDGIVVRPLELTLADLEALPQQKLTDDFVNCLA